MDINELSYIVIGIALKVHSELGPGLLESSYKELLVHKLRSEGLNVEKEKRIQMKSEGILVKCAYRMDLLIEGKLVIEIKSVNALHPVHVAQLLTYLRIGGYPLGLLFNFNVLHLRNGIKRVIL